MISIKMRRITKRANTYFLVPGKNQIRGECNYEGFHWGDSLWLDLCNFEDFYQLEEGKCAN